MDLVFEEYETLPEDADGNAKRLEEASGRLYQKDVQCRSWIEGYGSEKNFPGNRRPWLCTPDGEVHLYDQNGFEVARMTNRMTDNKIAMWQCQLCGNHVQAWVTLCPIATCAGVNPCVTRQHSNSARLDQLKHKIANGIPLTWYEKECSNAHCAAIAKGEFCE